MLFRITRSEFIHVKYQFGRYHWHPFLVNSEVSVSEIAWNIQSYVFLRGDDRPANSRSVPEKDGVESTIGQAMAGFLFNEIQDFPLANKLALVVARSNESTNRIFLPRRA
jgi:hypothetical protein